LNGFKKNGISCKNDRSEEDLVINNDDIEEDLFNGENINLDKEKNHTNNSEESDLSDYSDDIK
jgi:hypothetical protein